MSLLTDDRSLAKSIETALAPNSKCTDHVPIEVLAPRPPFDLTAVLDADCLLVDAHLPNADRVYSQWRQMESEDSTGALLAHASKRRRLLGSPDRNRRRRSGRCGKAAATSRRDRRGQPEATRRSRRPFPIRRSRPNACRRVARTRESVEQHSRTLDRVRSLLPPDENLARWNGIIERNGALLREALADLLDGFRFNLEPKPVALHPIIDRAFGRVAVAADANVRGRIRRRKAIRQVVADRHGKRRAAARRVFEHPGQQPPGSRRSKAPSWYGRVKRTTAGSRWKSPTTVPELRKTFYRICSRIGGRRNGQGPALGWRWFKRWSASTGERFSKQRSERRSLFSNQVACGKTV